MIWFFGKIYPRYGLFKKVFVSCDTGLSDQDYWRTVMVAMTNNDAFPFVVNVGNRISETVFHKKENVVFKKVYKLSCTAHGSGGSGSTEIWFFLVKTKKITFEAVDYAKKVFFECYESIENIQAADVYLCEQYSGCQSIKNFQKIKRDTVASVSSRIDLT